MSHDLVVLETQFSGDNIVLVFPDGSTPALLSAMMAGIPYNKAHVLEFTPGEIRLDIRMAPTLKLYETKLQANAEKYDTLVQQGKVELDRLRSLTEEELVSKKDLIIEKERIEIEAEYQRKEAARLTKEEDERQARVTRQRELETSRLKSRGIVVDASSDGTMDEASVPPLIIGGAFAAYAVVALSSAGQNESKYKGSNDTNLVQPIANLAVNTTGEPLRPGSIGNPVSLYSDTSIINNYSELQGDIFSDLLGDASSTTYENNPSLYGSVPKSKEERQEDARNAMQSYMDEDDGADAWLQVMANIIRDDDDENDIFLLDSEDKDGIGRVKGSD